MDDYGNHDPEPAGRDIVSTWGIAAMVIVALFAVSLFRTVTPDPGVGDVYTASERGAFPDGAIPVERDILPRAEDEAGTPPLNRDY